MGFVGQSCPILFYPILSCPKLPGKGHHRHVQLNLESRSSAHLPFPSTTRLPSPSLSPLPIRLNSTLTLIGHPLAALETLERLAGKTRRATVSLPSRQLLSQLAQPSARPPRAVRIGYGTRRARKENEDGKEVGGVECGWGSV